MVDLVDKYTVRPMDPTGILFDMIDFYIYILWQFIPEFYLANVRYLAKL